MRLVFKILIVFSFLLTSVFAREVTFAFITDVELNPHNAYKLQNTIKELNANKQLDFVVFGGNNLNSPNMDNLRYFTYLLKRVHKKTYVLAGATDCSTSKGIDKEFYFKKVKHARFLFHSKDANYVFKKGGIVFIAMDGAKQYIPQKNGCYSKQNLVWLKAKLEKYKNRHTIVILQHFPLLETSSKWLETAKMEDYYTIIKNYDNIKYIVSGHYGQNSEVKTDNITHILTERYSESGAYKIITIDSKDDFYASHLVK